MPDLTIYDILETSSEEVKKNTIVVNSHDIQTPYLLHISGEKNPKYIPRIGHRQGHSEDRTMPRVTASTCLTGCMVGYASMLQDFLDQNILTGKGHLKDWKGGFYIHKLPFEYCLKPNKKLVYDADRSNEHWLVTYDENTRQFDSSLIGRIVYDKVTLEPVTGGYAVYFSFFIELKEAASLDNTTLYDPGYYAGVFKFDRNTSYKNASLSFEEVTRDMYLNRKREVASMLSAETKQIYSKW